MRIRAGEIDLNVEIKEKTSDKSKIAYLLLLHGFTGSSGDWEELISRLGASYRVIALDITGHGKSDSPKSVEYYTQQEMIKQLNILSEKLKLDEPFYLYGYSMGGRFALSYAVEYPEKLKGLMLESTTAGIQNEKERKKRREDDKKLAEFILNSPIEKFIDYWINLPLFDPPFAEQKKLPEEKLRKVRERKLKNNKTGLANSLLGFGSGSMEPLYDRLNKIKCKTLLITGGLDEKYTKLNHEMVRLFPDAEHKIIKGAGHKVSMTDPTVISDILIRFSE